MAQRTIQYKNGDFYKGEVNRHFLAHGKGVMQYNNGAVYEGEFKNGIRFGAGAFRSAEGDEYVGSFRNDIPEGYGRASFCDGRSYEGEWRHGEINGKGIFTEPNGDSYEGFFKEGIKEGEGTFIGADGRRIAQRYVDGKLAFEDGGGLPVITIVDECKRFGYYHYLVCRFVAKVGQFKYKDMQVLEFGPWDCEEILENIFTITEVGDDSIKFIYKSKFSDNEPREEIVYRGEKGAFDNHETKIGGMSFMDFGYRQEASLSVSCE
ncbi:MAG: hypothetical protein J6O40_00685 [Ruminococcus sp.]|nr:hypothetical protein [Ruminococcus sp.]